MAMLSVEELKGLLGDLELNEGTLGELQALIENSLQATIDAQVKDATDVLNEQHEAALAMVRKDANRYGEYIKEEISAKVDGYTSYVMGEYIKENEEKFKALEHLNRLDEALKGVKAAFEASGFEVVAPTSLEEGLRSELQESKAALDNMLTELNENKTKLREAELTLLFQENTKGLADTQREKVRQLMESVSFDSVEDYAKGLTIMTEQVIAAKPAPVDTLQTLNEEVTPEKKARAERMDKYVAALGPKK